MTNKTEETVRNYFLKISGGDERFSDEMIKELYSYTKRVSSKSKTEVFILVGADLKRVAQKTNTDLSNYFLPGDLNFFEMEVVSKKGEILSIIYVDAPRKQHVKLV